MTPSGTASTIAKSRPAISVRWASLCATGAGAVEPVDVSNAVLWLASDEASWVTGSCFTVDGGLTAASPLALQLF